jgi:hypothetical protein
MTPKASAASKVTRLHTITMNTGPLFFGRPPTFHAKSYRNRKATLIARFGAEIPLPDLRHKIAQCERDQKLGDACAVQYLDLTLGTNPPDAN